MEGGDPLQVFREVRDKWLVDGESSPFSAKLRDAQVIAVIIGRGLEPMLEDVTECSGQRMDKRCTLMDNR